MRRALLIPLLLAGCTWSNSLYQARRMTGIAERAEREGRTFDASSYWAQAITKADSAYARSPVGGDGAEALGVRGRARARIGDCAGGAPEMEQALLLADNADWRIPVALELARCRLREGQVAQALAVARTAVKPGNRYHDEAALVLGEALLASGAAAEAMAALADVEPERARWVRVRALAMLDRTDEALVELRQSIADGDVAGNWLPVLRMMGERDPGDARALLADLVAMPGADSNLVASWRLAAAEGMIRVDRDAASTLLWELVRTGSSASHSRARLMLADLEVGSADDPQDLRELAAQLGELAVGDPVVAFRLERYRRIIAPMLEDIDSLAPGSPSGDMAMFFHAEFARDSLAARGMAEWFLIRMEQGWPSSPYRPKGMMARIMLPSDSAEALRVRLAAIPDNPYLEFMRGIDNPRLRQLEDSLGNYISDRVARIAAKMVEEF